MKISDVISFLEKWAPPGYQESYDNSGLLVGDKSLEVSGVLICLDSIEAVIDEAIDKGCNLVVAHHPIVFSGLKRFTGKDYIERTIIKAIKNDIAIYAIHTNLDSVSTGVNAEIGKRLGLDKLKILSPKKNDLVKVVVFVPVKELNEVRSAMFNAGAGELGNYENCSFSQQGSGTFKPLHGANPSEGALETLTNVNEERLEMMVSKPNLGAVISAMLLTHSYEEVAYDVIPLNNKNKDIGAGMIGELIEEVGLKDFLLEVKSSFNVGSVKYTNVINSKVKKIAFCGGSGSFLLNDAIAQKADVFLTADYKYHQFFDADNKIVIVDIGHYESEQFTIDLISARLKKKFSKFAVHLTGINTNPVNYL